MRTFVLLALVCLTSAMAPAHAQEPLPVLSVPPAAANADPAAATRAWLETVPADKKQKSDAYFEGGYWLILWNFLLTAAISLLLLETCISARLRNFAERTTRMWVLRIVLYAVIYVLLTSALSCPLYLYEHFFREHQYGLATQTFGPWVGEQLTRFVIALVISTVLLIVFYGLFRRAPRTWPIWGTLVLICFFIFSAIIEPVYIDPLFNKYTPLQDPRISEPILALARANEIPVQHVFEVDASRQSNRVSANVAGFLGTTRIALNDNLLKRCSLPEIRAVMGHEMGHYVLNHSIKFTAELTLLALVALFLARVAFDGALRKWGERWQVRGIADPATLPLLALITSTISFLATPVLHTMTRMQEREADAFGINASREPDGMAAVALKLGTYRKLDPTPLEEFIFFDHPSGRARIRMAMDWKAARLPAGEVTQ